MLTKMKIDPDTAEAYGIWEVTDVKQVFSGWVIPGFSIGRFATFILKIECSGKDAWGNNSNITRHLHFYGDEDDIRNVEGPWIRDFEHRNSSGVNFSRSESEDLGLSTFDALDTYIRCYNYHLQNAIKNDSREISGRDIAAFLCYDFSKLNWF